VDSKLTTTLGQPSRVAHMTTGPATHDTHIYGTKDTVTQTTSLQRTRGGSPEADKVYSALDEAGLLQIKGTLQSRLNTVRDYVRRVNVEPTLVLDPGTGAVTGLTSKITLLSLALSSIASGIPPLTHCYTRPMRLCGQRTFGFGWFWTGSTSHSFRTMT
jgi:hypothetical protein